MKIRVSLTSFQRYSSSLSFGFRQNEFQERVKKFGFDLHLPQDGTQTVLKERSLALLVGWAESRQKAMAKFASIYARLGIPCLTMAPSIWSMWFTSVGNRLTSNLITSLDSATPPSDPPMNLLMHVFSGGGTTVFPKLAEELANPNGLLTTKIKPKCIIFDSGPTRFSYQSGAAAAKLVYKQGGFNFFTYTTSKLIGSAVNIFIGSRKRSELTDALESQLLDLPQLYLYSKADSVCLSGWVEKVMKEQRKKGRDVESFSWEHSEHVRHLIEHPEQYEKLVVDFTKKHIK